MMGREKVNSLYDYFVAKFGSPDSLEFARARMAFAKSLAPYSLIIFLLQIKDRHNGNIMIDESGHILHIGTSFVTYERRFWVYIGSVCGRCKL
jgi:phosphatidylinositol 4-kinase